MAARQYSTTRAAINRAQARGAVAMMRSAGVLNLSGSFRAATPTRLRDRPTSPLATANAHRDQWTRERLVRYCQDQARNNPIARTLIRRAGEIVAGARPGLRLHSDSDTWNGEAAAFLERWFTEGFDHEGMLTFEQFAAFVVENGREAGDGLVVLLADGSCQWIDGVRIKNDQNRQDTPESVGGVVLDPTGRVLGYRVARWNAQGTVLSATTDFIDARDCIYVGNPRGPRPGQRRAEPSMVAVLDRLEDLERYHLAVGKAAELAALFSIFIRSANPEASPLDFSTTGEQGEDAGAIERARDAGEIAVFPGSINELQPGEDISTTNPSQPSAQYDRKVWTDIRIICAEMGVPLELGWFKYDSNYAASRSAIVSAWMGVLKEQAWLADRVLTPIVRWRLAVAIRRGEIKRVPGWERVRWNLPGVPTLDLGNEIDAVTRGIAGGVMLREDAVARINNGMGIDAYYEARGLELARERTLGIATTQPSAVNISVTPDPSTTPTPAEAAP